MSGRPSWKSAEIGLFRPFSAFFACFRRALTAPGKSRKRRKKAFFLRYPLVCLNPHLLNPHLRHSKKINANFICTKFFGVMDVNAENHGRPRQKVRFPAAPVVGRNFLTPGHPGVRVRNVRGKSGPKSLFLCCFFFPDRCCFTPPAG